MVRNLDCLPDMTICNVLGETREAHDVYPDGSWNCPFCSSANYPGDAPCRNPGCEASKYANAERILAERDRQVALVREAAERQARAEWAAQYQVEQTQARVEFQQSVITMAQERKACVRCALESTHHGFRREAKYTRHRGQCPRERK